MPTESDTNSPTLGVCRRLIKFIMTSFTGQGYKRIPFSPAPEAASVTVEDSSSSNKTNSLRFHKSNGRGQEVIIDFRHIEEPENSPFLRSGTPGKSDALIQRRKSCQEIKINPGGTQGSSPSLMIRIEEGRETRGGGRKQEQRIPNGSGETTFPFNIDDAAEKFIRSRKKDIAGNYSSDG